MKRAVAAVALVALGSLAVFAQQKYHFKEAVIPDLTWTDEKTDTIRTFKFDASTILDDPMAIRWGTEIVFGVGQPFQKTRHQEEVNADEQGYEYLTVSPFRLADGSFLDRLLVVQGAGWFFTDLYFRPDPSFYRLNSDGLSGLLDKKRRNADRSSFDWIESLPAGFADDGIKSVGAWSELTETLKGKIVHYRAGNMRHPIIVVGPSLHVPEYRFEYNHIDPPWAEGVPGAGIGGTIDVTFTRPSERLFILNGYVDLAKRHLYKQNNRLKTIRIDSADPAFSITVSLEDVVRFHEIALPLATTGVRLAILDVYKGTKYDDTCVSKIFIPQAELRPRKEYEAEIEKALRMAGYFKDL